MKMMGLSSGVDVVGCCCGCGLVVVVGLRVDGWGRGEGPEVGPSRDAMWIVVNEESVRMRVWYRGVVVLVVLVE